MFVELPLVPLPLFESFDGEVMLAETGPLVLGLFVSVLVPPRKRLPAVNLPVQMRTFVLL